jgi:hypothetical protein
LGVSWSIRPACGRAWNGIGRRIRMPPYAPVRTQRIRRRIADSKFDSLTDDYRMRHAFGQDEMPADCAGCGLYNVGIGQARRPLGSKSSHCCLQIIPMTLAAILLTFRSEIGPNFSPCFSIPGNADGVV